MLQLPGKMRTDFPCVPVPRNRADDRRRRAATRVQPAPRVTLNWQAQPFTLKEREDKKWKREKNGRRVLVTSRGGKAKYWRAPRPRPRLHRRLRRKEKQGVIKCALKQSAANPASLHEAEVAIKVLQEALRSALQREDSLKSKLQQAVAKVNKLVPEEPGDDVLQKSHAAESGFAGVTRNKHGWAAHTNKQQGERTHLGTFDTPIEAARVRRDYYADVVAAIEQAPQYIPNTTFCVFWSIVIFVIVNTGIPWYLVPVGLILIYGLLLSMVDV